MKYLYESWSVFNLFIIVFVPKVSIFVSSHQTRVCIAPAMARVQLLCDFSKLLCELCAKQFLTVLLYGIWFLKLRSNPCVFIKYVCYCVVAMLDLEMTCHSIQVLPAYGAPCML